MILSISHLRKLQLRELEDLAQSHTARRGRLRIPSYDAPKHALLSGQV